MNSKYSPVISQYYLVTVSTKVYLTPAFWWLLMMKGVFWRCLDNVLRASSILVVKETITIDSFEIICTHVFLSPFRIIDIWGCQGNLKNNLLLFFYLQESSLWSLEYKTLPRAIQSLTELGQEPSSCTLLLCSLPTIIPILLLFL